MTKLYKEIHRQTVRFPADDKDFAKAKAFFGYHPGDKFIADVAVLDCGEEKVLGNRYVIDIKIGDTGSTPTYVPAGENLEDAIKLCKKVCTREEALKWHTMDYN